MLCDAVDHSKHELQRLGKLGRRWLTVVYGERPAMVTMLNEVNVGRRYPTTGRVHQKVRRCCSM